MKKTILKTAFMFILFLGLLIFPLNLSQVNAAEVASGTGWNLDDNGVITITADISDSATYEWQTYDSQIKEVVVADGVTRVPSSAFYSNNGVNYSNLTKVSLSSSVEEVGLYAFADNPSLVDVNLNDGLKIIGNLAFKGAGFTQITLPSNAQLSSDAFQGCSVTSLTIPAGTTWGGNAQFSHCHSLTEVIFEDGITDVGQSVFMDCPNLKYVWIPKSVEKIDSGVLAVQNLTIIGYKGSGAEEYANSGTAEVNNMTFHAIDGDSHDYTNWKVVKEATCEDEGLKESVCLVCGAKGTQVIPAKGHSFDKGVITKEPTTKEEGIKTYTCSVCKKTKTEIIPKLTSDKTPEKTVDKVNSSSSNIDKSSTNNNQAVQTPKTADNSNVYMWILVMSLSIVALLSAVIKVKHKNN